MTWNSRHNNYICHVNHFWHKWDKLGQTPVYQQSVLMSAALSSNWYREPPSPTNNQRRFPAPRSGGSVCSSKTEAGPDHALWPLPKLAAERKSFQVSEAVDNYCFNRHADSGLRVFGPHLSLSPQKRNTHMCSAVLTSAVSTWGLWPSHGQKEGGSWWGGIVGQGQEHPGLLRGVRATGGHHRRAGQHGTRPAHPSDQLLPFTSEFGEEENAKIFLKFESKRICPIIMGSRCQDLVKFWWLLCFMADFWAFGVFCFPGCFKGIWKWTYKETQPDVILNQKYN